MDAQSKGCLELFLSAWPSPLCRSFTLDESQETATWCSLQKAQAPRGAAAWKAPHGSFQQMSQRHRNKPATLLLSKSDCSQEIRCQKVGLSLGSAPRERLQLLCILVICCALVAALFMPHFLFFSMLQTEAIALFFSFFFFLSFLFLFIF